MRNPHQLTQGSQAILDEMTSYHRRRLFDFEDRLRANNAEDKRTHPVDLHRAIQHMATGDLSNTAEGEFFAEVARRRDTPFDPQRIHIPFLYFDRALTAASAAGGGYIVGVANLDPADVLRSWSVAVQGGITVEGGLTGNAVIPKTTATSAINWQANEVAQAAPSTPTIAQAAMTPKVAIGLINASHQFMKQADPERWIRRELLRTAGTAIDQAVLMGTGASGQPLGLVNTPGVSTQVGTGFDWAAALTMKRIAAAANAQDNSTAFITTPEVRELLEGRERAAGSGFIWGGNRVAGQRAFATTDMPAGAMVSGPMDGVTLGLWGTGIDIEVDPSTNFKSGGVVVRVLVGCDVAVTVDPAAFTVATSIN